MRKASLFSGIGGIDLAAHWAGMETVVFCEREPFPQKVLQKNFPGVPILDDVHDFTREELERRGIFGDGRTIDIISAGYPCQPFSHAGQRRGSEDDRHLWPEVKRILEEIRPRWFLGENVAGHITLGLDDVLSDLGGAGYTAQALVIPAAAVGASHKRDRVFIVGYTDSVGRSAGVSDRQERYVSNHEERDNKKDQSERERWFAGAGETGSNVADSSSEGFPEWGQSGGCKSRTETGTRLDTEPERCCEVVANTEGKRCREARECVGRSEERTTGCCIMGNANSIELQREQFIRNTAMGRRDTPREHQRTGDGTGESGATQPRMGGDIAKFPAGMDRSINPLDALTEFIASYPQPALMGMPQHDWEPPRVATGVKDRVGRLKALGNAVDPLQVLPILYAIKVIDSAINTIKTYMGE